MRLLVAGGREYGDRDFLFLSLDRVHAKCGVTCIIHGGARGADTMAGQWAYARGVLAQVFPITPEEWKRLGHMAGPMRNDRMLREGKPDGVVVFSGGGGTADMARRTMLAGVPLWDLRPRAQR